MINLDYLLDEDFLTPQQKRLVRSFTDLEIQIDPQPVMNKTYKYAVSYKSKMDSSQSIAVALIKNREEEELTLYKIIMFNHIQCLAKTLDNQNVIDEIKKIFSSGKPLDRSKNRQSLITFKNNDNFFMNHFPNVSAQTLFRAMYFLTKN